ncbi:hypothetical protein V1517DRAFT_330924 [Lipomyces orientalis]|uniref:Uncharacterized protein n=1 Tax=Lipomyces orientalis TaxID=1233043 RepID=A0ACC3TFJ6_9ASCO
MPFSSWFLLTARRSLEDQSLLTASRHVRYGATEQLLKTGILAPIQLVKGYATRKRLTMKEYRKVRAKRAPHVETKSYLKKTPLRGTNPIFGTYSTLVKQILRTLRTEDSRALTPDSVITSSSPFYVSTATPGYGVTETELQNTTFGAQKAAAMRASAVLHEWPAKAPLAKAEETKGEATRRILSLRHGNADHEKAHLIRAVVKEFGESEIDTGSPESQAAILTVRILAMAEHLRYNLKDKITMRSLTIMVQQRNSMLKYLKKRSLPRYMSCLKKLGLDDSVVSKEFRFSKRLLE